MCPQRAEPPEDRPLADKSGCCEGQSSCHLCSHYSNKWFLSRIITFPTIHPIARVKKFL